MMKIPKRVQNLIGQEFSRLTVIGYSHKNKQKNSYWLCRCACGNERVIRGTSFRSGGTYSCGCLAKEQSRQRAKQMSKGNRTHGLTKHPLYLVWRNMIQRCTNPKDLSWRNYGGRGITVCKRWLGSEGLANFIQNMGPRLTTRHTLERIDNDGPYSPRNCRWATRKEQARNSRRNRYLIYQGKAQCVIDWAKELGIPTRTLYTRLRLGWPIERVLTEPIHVNYRRTA